MAPLGERHVISSCIKMAFEQQVASSMTILHISDVHGGYDMIEKLKQWIADKHLQIDLTLLSGDMTNMPMSHDLSQEMVDSFAEEFDRVVTATASLSSRMLYIPGNHDPVKFFPSMEEKLTVGQPTWPVANIHNRAVRLGPDLCILGHGGSIPTYRDGQQFWKGFPCTSVEEYTEDIKKLLASALASDHSPLKAEDSVILMVHNGPDKSSTAMAMHSPRQPVNSGVPYLGEFLTSSEAQNRIFLTIHGHTHMCAGKVEIGSVTISNPGSLKEGRFAVYQLERGRVHPLYKDAFKGQWAITSASYYTLH